MTHNIVTHKSKTVAVLLCLTLGSIGAHRFYLGHPWLACSWILLTIVCLASGAMVVITALLCIEALVLLFRSKAYYKRVEQVEVVT
jgi:TM2 domain-containing membrane protein YozV|tara:strand:- start:750 stop:1007 length:258 start_codon:yes stop_codon:yes gene_type:complete